MFKTLISIIMFLCQLLQSFLPVCGNPGQNEGIEFDTIESAIITGEYALGDEDPVITVELENTVASDSATADMFELTDLFSALEITEVACNGASVTLFTDGVIPYEIPLTGGVDIAAEATQSSTEIHAGCELLMRSAYISQDSFSYADGVLSFTMVLLNGTSALAAGDALEGDGLVFTVKSVSEDGTAVTLTVPVEASDLEAAIALVDGKELLIPGEKLSSGEAQTVAVYAKKTSFGATVKRIAKTGTADLYNVTAILYVKNGTFADDLCAEDITLGGVFENATISSLTKNGDANTFEFAFEKSGISLNKVVLEGSATVADGKILNLRGTKLRAHTADLNYSRYGFSLDGYKQITAFIPAEKGVFDKLSDIGSFIGTASSIIGGVTAVLEFAGVLESTDDKIEESRRIIKEVQEAIAALDAKLDKMGATLTSGTIETLSAVQYNTYMTASGNWDQFLSSYVVPLKNELNEFTMAYNEYMLNYIMNAHSLLHTVTVWKDVDGNVTLPHPSNGANSTWYSVDGKVLASMDPYKLVAELKGVQAKVMANGGRLYDGYWEDIVAEIKDRQFESMFVHITKEEYLDAVQMNAALYALEQTGAADILNVFTRFCNALVGEGSAGGLRPIDNYLTMLSMYYNFYTESKKDIDVTLTWLYSLLSEGAFVATVAYNFTPAAEKDIVNKSFDKAANQITKASVEKDPFYSYVANKTVTTNNITQHVYNTSKGLNPAYQTELYIGSCWDGNVVKPDTFKSGYVLDTVQLSLIYKRYEYLCETGVCEEPTFSRYLVSIGLVDSGLLFDGYGNSLDALILASPISLDDIPLDNSVTMEITRRYHSTWYNVGDVITIGTQGEVSKEYYTSHFRRCADTMDMNGNIQADNMLLGQAFYYESHWYWGFGNDEEWACIVAYPGTMILFSLS